MLKRSLASFLFLRVVLLAISKRPFQLWLELTDKQIPTIHSQCGHSFLREEPRPSGVFHSLEVKAQYRLPAIIRRFAIGKCSSLRGRD